MLEKYRVSHFYLMSVKNCYYYLLNRDLTTNIGVGIHSCDFMDRACNLYDPSKVNSE